MLKTVLDHQKTTVKSEDLPIGFGGVSLLRRNGICLCGISKECPQPEFLKCLLFLTTQSLGQMLFPF